MILETLFALQTRGGGPHVHLSPGELQAVWRLTQALGRAFWHMTPLAQCLTAGAPSAAGLGWLARWDPLAANRTEEEEEE